MFTGTLIEDLMATVERTEQYGRQNNPAEYRAAEPWPGIAAYDFAPPANQLLGVA